jgi:formylglycine-generating enzyme required for sulfatase activity
MGTPGGTCPDGYPVGLSCAKEPGRSTKDEALHVVALSYAFEMMQTEVTQAHFEALMGYNPSYFGPNGTGGDCGGDCPVESLSWHEALALANALSEQEGLEPCFDCKGSAPSVQCSLSASFAKPQDCVGYRLPTESEWEYAARAGTVTAFYNGPMTNLYRSPLDPALDEIGWYGGNSSSATSMNDCSGWFEGSTTCGPAPVAGKFANAWDLYDMSGNVEEWTWDGYKVYSAGTLLEPLVDPIGPVSAPTRAIRGGDWSSYAVYARCGYRNARVPGTRANTLGLRLVRSVF